MTGRAPEVPPIGSALAPLFGNAEDACRKRTFWDDGPER